MLNVKTPEEVINLINGAFSPMEIPETIEVSKALGRVLFRDVKANEYVPDFNRSTVDGYAVRSKDTFGCTDAIPAILTLQEEIRMGETASAPLKPDCCDYIPTGGALPEGADSVVMIEYSEDYMDGTIGLSKPSSPGQNVIFRGDDVYPGKVFLKKNRRLNASDIGALYAAGITTVEVYKQLCVGIVSTGDELVPPDAIPRVGEIRDVNSGMLSSLIQSFGANAINYGIIKDDEELLTKAVKNALDECDMVLISGGSSVGVKDAAARVIESFGELLFHGIAIKPGKPTILGNAGGKPIFGLPGHPVASYFITKLFVKRMVNRLCGQETLEYPVLAKITENISANHGRAQYQCCYLKYVDGELMAQPVRTKSGLITSLAGTDGYFCIDRDCEGLPKGAEIKVYLI